MIKRMVIGNNIYDVISPEELNANPHLYIDYPGMIAVERNGYAYPIVKNPNDYGLYLKNEAISVYNEPEGVNMEKYNTQNAIDFNNAKSMRDLIEINSQYKDLEYQTLISPDNIFIPTVTENDSPEMRALKTAVIDKNIDIDKYESRFGSNFQNDKRLFNNNSITLVKLKSIANALDIKATLTLEDRDPDVANPMKSKITVELTGGDINND